LLKLSRRRAENVATYLKSLGVDDTRLSTMGLGETERISYNTTAEGRQDNQRVNIIFTYDN
jgi:OOP family OmpA-OmpF porin